MSIKLPVVRAGLEIGEINLQTKEASIHNGATYISYSCNMSTDCCSNLQIPVTDFDIKRIEDHGYEMDQITESASPVIRFSKNLDGSGERNYWMKQKPFVGTCTFLEGDKCSIHEFKPFACRIFPFQLRDISEHITRVVIHKSNLCKSISTVPRDKSENMRILENILTVVINENKYREEYFEEYGNE